MNKTGLLKNEYINTISHFNGITGQMFAVLGAFTLAVFYVYIIEKNWSKNL